MASVGQKLAHTIGLGCPAQDGLTAHAGGGQGGATQIPNVLAGVFRFSTVATTGDSAVLPVPPTDNQSSDITVINAGAASMNVFPQSGGQINNAGANTAFALAAGKTANFFSISGVWHALLSA